MIKLMGKEINAMLGTQTILIWTYVCCGYSKQMFKLKDKNILGNPFIMNKHDEWWLTEWVKPG